MARARGIEALQALEIEFGIGILAESVLGVCFLIYYRIRVGRYCGSRAEVAQSLLRDVGSRCICRRGARRRAGARPLPMRAHTVAPYPIGQCADILAVAVVFVGARQVYVVVLGFSRSSSS